MGILDSWFCLRFWYRDFFDEKVPINGTRDDDDD